MLRIGLALVFLLPSRVLAVSFVPGPVDCSLGNGHCYQVIAIGGNAGAPFTWAEANEFARSQVADGHHGHLLTLETQAEYDSPLVPKIGYLGAIGLSNGSYMWTNGSEAGTVVSYFGPFTTAPIDGSDPSCGPFTRLCVSAAGYYGGPETAKLPSPLPGCPCEQSFVVEYEADLVAPQVTVLSPNGDEFVNAAPSAQTGFSWIATDNEAVADVDLALSRTGPDGPYETIAAHYPNAGIYVWQGSGPTADHSAFFRVTARDEAGNLAEDRSDAAFTIFYLVPAHPTTWGRVKSFYR